MAKKIAICDAKTDPKLREAFLKEHMAFVVHIASGVTGRYVSTVNDFEFSIGLEALNDAIDSYDNKHGKFETYAGTIVKNRIIDYLRKENRENYILLEEDVYRNIEDNQNALDMKIELAELTRQLRTFGIDFDDLVDISPKHIDTRRRAIQLGMHISASKEIMATIYKTLKLPVTMIVKSLKESRRFIYLHQKYILAVAIIFDMEDGSVKDWIKNVMGGESSDT